MELTVQNQVVPRSASADAEVQRSIAEVQGAIIIAKKFPRDMNAAMSEILMECQRPALAEVATYEYAKGGANISGPSIRLAETLALAWGNIHSGWKELARTVENGHHYSEIEAWAWDVERNKRESANFRVKLVRNTKKGSYALTDERDIYEHTANQAKRRERACILALIPGYIVDQAVEQCQRTLEQTVNKDTTAKMLKCFEEKYGVSKAQIEVFIQRNIEAITPPQVVRLRQIFNALRDGLARSGDFFSAEEAEQPQQKGNAGLKDKLKAAQPEVHIDPAKPGADTTAEAVVNTEEVIPTFLKREKPNEQ